MKFPEFRIWLLESPVLLPNITPRALDIANHVPMLMMIVIDRASRFDCGLTAVCGPTAVRLRSNCGPIAVRLRSDRGPIVVQKY